MHKPKQPVSTADMQRRGRPPSNSICQRLRMIYELTDDDEIKMHLRVATAMAKAMVHRLNEYKGMLR